MNLKQIENYNILEEIGQGGMSTVFRAQNTQNGQEVAIKVMRDKFTNNSNARERFIREAQMVLALNHPAIVPVYDYGELNGRLYIVMQYMPGGSVREQLNDGPLSFERALAILAPITSALVTAHKNNIIHRDVKPHNILLDEEGKAYLSDFGVARLLDEESLEHTMTLVGTPEFIAPEQAVEGGLTPQTDIYQLGISTFFLLTGQMPFSGNSLQVIQKHLHEPLPSAEELNPDLTLGTDKVLQIATAKNPEERFISAGDFFNALTQLTNESTRTEIFAAAWVTAPTANEFAFAESTPTEPAVVEVAAMEKRNAKRPLAYASAILIVLAGMMAFAQSDTMPEIATIEADSNPIAELIPDVPTVIEENNFIEEFVEEVEEVVEEVEEVIENVETAVTEIIPQQEDATVGENNETTIAAQTETSETDEVAIVTTQDNLVTSQDNNPPAQNDDNNPPAPQDNNDDDDDDDNDGNGGNNNDGGNRNGGDRGNGDGDGNPPPPPPNGGGNGNGGGRAGGRGRGNGGGGGGGGDGGN